MGYPPACRQAVRNLVGAALDAAIEHARQFPRQGVTLDTIEIAHRDVAGEARPYAGNRTIDRPFDQARNWRPDRIVFEVTCRWFGAGDDDTVRRILLQGREIFVVERDVGAC